MSLFFLILCVSNFLNLKVLIFFLPIIWFYSIFDVRQKFNDSEKPEDISYTSSSLSFEHILKTINSRFVGYLLIAIGIITISDNIVFPILEVYLDWQIKSYLKTGFGSFILILCGIKILTGMKSASSEKEDIN